MSSRRARFASSVFSLALSLASAGCGSPPPAADSGVDAGPADGAARCRTGGFGSMDFAHDSIGVVPGTSRHSYLDLSQDACDEVDITFRASASGIATTPTAITIPLGETRARIDVTGVAVGTITLTATATDRDGSTETATIEIAVTSPDRPSCDGSASGTVSPTPSGSVEVSSGLLDGSRVSLGSYGAKGLGVDYYWDGLADSYIGLASARKF